MAAVIHPEVTIHTTQRSVAVLGQQGIRTLAGNAGKRLWMSEYANGDFDVTDIRSGLTLSTQVCGELSQLPTAGRYGGGGGGWGGSPAIISNSPAWQQCDSARERVLVSILDVRQL